MPEIKFPQVKVQLTGKDGNVFNLIGIVAKALRSQVSEAAAIEFRNAAMDSSSYDEVLQLIMRTVDVS